MTALIVGLLLLSCAFGRTRGLLGGLAGAFLGAFVLAGMARTARTGELAAFYTPTELASSALPVALLGALLALIAPYAAAVASLAWGAGAVLGAIAVSVSGDAAYILPLALHAAGAASVMGLARVRAAAL